MCVNFKNFKCLTLVSRMPQETPSIFRFKKLNKNNTKPQKKPKKKSVLLKAHNGSLYKTLNTQSRSYRLNDFPCFFRIQIGSSVTTDKYTYYSTVQKARRSINIKTPIILWNLHLHKSRHMTIQNKLETNRIVWTLLQLHFSPTSEMLLQKNRSI